MADDELAQIRAARLAQLKQQGASQSNGANGGGTAGEDDQRKQQEEQRASILNQILEPEAADRLGRIRMVKESRAKEVEERLIMLARSGQLRSKVTEDQLKQLLTSLTEHEEQTGKNIKSAKVVRRTTWDDEDDLDDLLNDV
ncbi:hypothetical protein LTR64_008146 [Lithohypha guttulata]|uniref:Programmed cell death 5 n=1 Tax=Lithohypha guttulata TaxID=1690604 RepID=A0AAN7YKH9_9EURO|nr:hypothetical protein LTR51_008298 [Lithohypha guttulata]KAK5091623.1 hypothetical protein LTR05_001808 [Lithohypha guttulata]